MSITKISLYGLKTLEYLNNYFIIHILNIFSQSKELDNSRGQKLNLKGVKLIKILV
jgi:hypothetical protein